MSKTTARGIVRPKSGQFDSFAMAREVARTRNIVNGRGHRAIIAQDGRSAVIFRPAVASNRQRRVRVVQGV